MAVTIIYGNEFEERLKKAAELVFEAMKKMDEKKKVDELKAGC